MPRRGTFKSASGEIAHKIFIEILCKTVTACLIVAYDILPSIAI